MTPTDLRTPVRRLAPAVALGALALTLAGCGGNAVTAEEVEEQISTRLSEEYGQTPDDVSCPEELPAEEGAEMTCVVTAGSDTIDATVTVTGVEDGTVNFDIQMADEVN